MEVVARVAARMRWRGAAARAVVAKVGVARAAARARWRGAAARVVVA